MITSKDIFTLSEIPQYTVRFLDSEDGEPVQRLMEVCADYIEMAQGTPPGPAEAQSLYVGLPQGKEYDDKFLIGIFNLANELVGVVDLIRDYPATGQWWLGLLLLAPQERGKGVGKMVMDGLIRWLAGRGAQELRLAVVKENERARCFWERLGFMPIESRAGIKMGNKSHTVTIMRRALGEARQEERQWSN